MAGIYIHIPFCKKRCIYCDFFSSTTMEKRSEYTDALCSELQLRKHYLQGENIQTIYFGGGTPSQLKPEDFKKIFECIFSCFNFSETGEVTLEVNPDDITTLYLQDLQQFPFNRISLGVQSFCDSELIFLNRRHNAFKARESIQTCKAAGFQNISIDLMYGLPGQTLDIWKSNLQQAIDSGIQHISAYHLIYEEGTGLYRLLKEKKTKEINEDLSVEMFSTMIDMLTSAGFEHYEISNFARPPFVSMHNSSYWNGTKYLGIGASAHSFNGKERHWNVANLDEYINSIQQGKVPAETEIIGEKEQYNDFILTRMRTMRGINLSEMESIFGKMKREDCLRQAQKHIANGMMEISGSHMRLTKAGIFVSDGIMIDLFL